MHEMNQARGWQLYLVLDTGLLRERDPLQVAEQALQGGAAVIQLRAKGWTARRQLQLAQALAPLTRAYRVPLILNDDVALALAAGADGVHLGVADLPVPLARRLMPQGLIGYSPEGSASARRAVAAGASYLGVGPFSATETKSDAGEAIGAQGIAEIAQAVPIPVVAIGGITPTTAGEAVAAGAAGVAAASTVITAPDVAAAARELRTAVSRAHSLAEGRRDWAPAQSADRRTQ